MKYQRARILQSKQPGMIGRLVWVVSGEPIMRSLSSYADVFTDAPVEPGPVLQSNITTAIPGSIGPVWVRPENVALLPEFADDVPPVSFEDWLKEPCKENR